MNEINILEKKNELLKVLVEGCRIHPYIELVGKQQSAVQNAY